MEALFHLIFEFIKISILASAYAAIFLLVFILWGKISPNNWTQRVNAHRRGFCYTFGLGIFIILFCWMFTYWGDHGLGDSARIPIGYAKEINEINGNQAYINLKDSEDEMINIESFFVKEDVCVGETGTKDYFFWNLRINEIEIVSSKESYDAKALSLNLPSRAQFQTFEEAYRNHWSGWRFWLLP
ncbi:MAG: hypothetical protein GYB31_18465 [Bacteroidetes bacterium]|nr:hypothetical protein [Bacteroidota bacterium]